MLSGLIINLIPLYVLIALGYIAGRWLDVNLHSIARINIFILLPIVSFGAVMQMQFTPAYILLPFMLFGVSVVVMSAFYKTGRLVFKDGSAGLLGSGSANGNSLYFGLPIIMALFGPEMAGVFIFMNLGPQISNLTIGYFLAARGKNSMAGSFKKLLKFPVIHAIWPAILLNVSGAQMPSIALQYWEYAVGALAFLGMMMIGVALGKLERFAFDWKLTGMLFISKFIAWPLLCLSFVLLDHYVLHLFSGELHQIIMVFSVMPLIGNLVAYASEHNLYPERAAAAVLASTLFTLVTIPGVFALMQWLSIG
jgi:predicted permease